MAAASTSRSSASRRPTARAISTSASSARSWPAPAASSTSARTPRRWCSSAPSLPASCELAIEAGRLRIRKDGTSRKFVSEVEHRTFSGEYAAAREQPVLYITERCVFRLTADGLELIEIAPGIDIERDILAQMDFAPGHARPPRLMDDRIFRDEPDGTARSHAGAARSTSASATTPSRTCSSSISSGFASAGRSRTSRAFDSRSRQRLAPLGHKVYAIVNYDNFTIVPELLDAYSATWCSDWSIASTRASRATRPAASCAEARRGAAATRRRAAHLRECRGGACAPARAGVEGGAPR